MLPAVYHGVGARANDDPTEYFLTCLHLLVNVGLVSVPARPYQPRRRNLLSAIAAADIRRLLLAVAFADYSAVLARRRFSSLSALPRCIMRAVLVQALRDLVGSFKVAAQARGYASRVQTLYDALDAVPLVTSAPLDFVPAMPTAAPRCRRNRILSPALHKRSLTRPIRGWG